MLKSLKLIRHLRNVINEHENDLCHGSSYVGVTLINAPILRTIVCVMDSQKTEQMIETSG